MINSLGTSNAVGKKKYFLESSDKSNIPGFHADSKRKQAEDKNLQPFYTPSSKALQYGDTSLNSISTDDTVWSHGECLNISKYEGKFLVKRGMSSKKVIEKTRIQNHYSSCL